MARINLVRQDDFTGGLNLRADQFQLAPNESPDLLNVEIDPRGGVFSRGGWKELGTATGTWSPKRLHPFYGASPYLMMSTGAGVYYRTTSNFTSLSLTPDATWGASFANWGSTLYMALGHTTAANKWNGTTLTALTASGTGAWQNDYTNPTGTHCPKAKLNITHAGKLWVANTFEDGVARPNCIRWSHENDPESWAELDFVEINDGSDGITGLASFAGQLIVYKTNSMYAIMGYNSDTFQVVELSRKVGAVSPMAVGVSERGAYSFSWPEGLHYYDGKSLYDIFEPLRPMITLSNVNAAQTNKIFVNVINERIWLSLPYSESSAVSNPSCSFVYDPSIGRQGAYTKLSTALARPEGTTETFGISGGCGFVSADGTSRGLALHPTRGVVMSVDNYDLPKDTEIALTQVSFDSYYRTRWIDGGMYVQKKMFRRPTLVAKQVDSNTDIVVDVYHDYEEENRKRTFTLSLVGSSTSLVWRLASLSPLASSQWGTGIWGLGSAGGVIEDSKALGLCKAVQLKLTGESGKEWGVNSITWKFSPRRVRG